MQAAGYAALVLAALVALRWAYLHVPPDALCSRLLREAELAARDLRALGATRRAARLERIISELREARRANDSDM